METTRTNQLLRPSEYGTEQVADIVGVSYRQLDYWLRQGKITISGPSTPGSGHWRRWTPDEVALLVRVVALKKYAESILDEFDTGALWDAGVLGDLPTINERNTDGDDRAPEGADRSD